MVRAPRGLLQVDSREALAAACGQLCPRSVQREPEPLSTGALFILRFTAFEEQRSREKSVSIC